MPEPMPKKGVGSTQGFALISIPTAGGMGGRIPRERPRLRPPPPSRSSKALVDPPPHDMIASLLVSQAAFLFLSRPALCQAHARSEANSPSRIRRNKRVRGNGIRV